MLIRITLDVEDEKIVEYKVETKGGCPQCADEAFQDDLGTHDHHEDEVGDEDVPVEKSTS